MFALYYIWNLIRPMDEANEMNFRTRDANDTETDTEDDPEFFESMDKMPRSRPTGIIQPQTLEQSHVGISVGAMDQFPANSSRQNMTTDLTVTMWPSAAEESERNTFSSEGAIEEEEGAERNCPTNEVATAIGDRGPIHRSNPLCPKDDSGRNEENIQAPWFDTPVYIQRYQLVKRILEENNIESVVDFGSAECNSMRYIRNVESIRRIAFVDADKIMLKRGLDNVKPILYDYLCRRLTPLNVSVLHGNAGDLDSRVAGFQAACLIEIIEHLHSDELNQVTDCVFGRLRPAFVIVTTPNADFNVLFPDLMGFRHWDHKFEWSKEEFQEWCNDVCEQCGYSVRYTGVGDPPEEMKHVGFCSQAAIFTEIAGKSGEQTEDKPYKLVYEVNYPVDMRTSAQRLADEVTAIVNKHCCDETFQSEDGLQSLLPVSYIISCLQHRPSEDHWSEGEILEHVHSSYTLTDDGSNIVKNLHQEDGCSGSESDSDLWHGQVGDYPGHPLYEDWRSAILDLDDDYEEW